MYLLDTNAVSELRRLRPHGAVLAWVSRVRPADLHLSAMTIGELQAGVGRTRSRDPGKVADLEAWIEQVVSRFPTLPTGGPAFRGWAKLTYKMHTTVLVKTP